MRPQWHVEPKYETKHVLISHKQGGSDEQRMSALFINKKQNVLCFFAVMSHSRIKNILQIVVFIYGSGKAVFSQLFFRCLYNSEIESALLRVTNDLLVF